jgi:hypothetical protein
MGKTAESLHFNDLACLSPKWVQQCDLCKPTKDALDALYAERTKAVDYPGPEIRGLDKVEIDCIKCQGRGWILTEKGHAILKLVQFLCSPDQVEKEIPF